MSAGIRPPPKGDNYRNGFLKHSQVNISYQNCQEKSADNHAYSRPGGLSYGDIETGRFLLPGSARIQDREVSPKQQKRMPESKIILA